ncbi:MAG TPA: aminotransferase class IV, partial [Nitrospiria bacterium]|nr:aminotransferase class IV [Nitrospiria bacterium]
MRVFLNGRWVPPGKARVSVLDHGFLYGDGVFETLRAYNGSIFRLSAHLSRLRRSARRLRIRLPYPGEQFSNLLRMGLRKNKLADAVLRVAVTRGPGAVGLDPSLCKNPTVVFLVRPFKGHPKDSYRRGLTASICGIRRIPPESLDPAIKSGNFLNNILARMESLDRNTDEGIMLSTKGTIAEGTVSNVFFVSRNRIYTPALDTGILPGISRDVVMDLARRAGYTVREGRFRPARLKTADECFLTNTSMEVMPVVRVDG